LLQLLLAARVAEYHLVPCTRKDRSELAAHQPRTQDADSHDAISSSESAVRGFGFNAALAVPAPMLPAPVINQTSSATYQAPEMFRIAGSLKRNLRDRAIDGAKVLGRQFDGSRADGFLQAMQLRGAGYRHDPRLLGEEPGERDLRRRHLFPGCDLAQQIDQGVVRLARLRREAGDDVAEVGAVE